jgi:translation initiation factor 2 subunit 3
MDYFNTIYDDCYTDVLTKQPIINIGCLGSVSDGKSTLVRVLTNTKTQKYKSEKVRNITIKQGYGNMKMWYDYDNKQFYTTDSTFDTFITDDGECKLVNHLSFVDCPGHQELIQTMLSSISLMDGAIVVIAVDQPLNKKPQLIQHLAAAKLGKLPIIICLNKIDLVKQEVLLERKRELDELLLDFGIEPLIIIPTSFNRKINFDVLLLSIMTFFNPINYLKKTSESSLFQISRTFDINKPGTNWDEVVGGVVGGSLMSGKFKIGDEIEIRPGYVSKANGKFVSTPIKTTVLSIKTDNNDLEEIIPGGLTGIRTDLDTFYCKNDALAGNIIGLVGSVPSVFIKLTIDSKIVNLFGTTWNPTINDDVVLQIGTRSVNATLIKMNESKMTFELNKPTCIKNEQHIVICKNVDKILKIVGEGIMFIEDNNDIFIV